MTAFDPLFRYPIRTSQALGYDEPTGQKKTSEDIASDLDFMDFFLETYLSEVGKNAINAGTVVEYTPTITGLNWALGNGTLLGRKVAAGLTMFIAKFTIGSTTTLGDGALGIALPVTNAVTLTPANCMAYDSSSGNLYGGTAELQSTLAYPRFGTLLLGAQIVGVTSTAPFTFSTADVVIVTGVVNPI